jgi:TonB family protein
MRTNVFLPLFLLAALFLPLSFGCAQSEQVSGNRKVMNKVIPEYPRLARDMNIRGTVRLEVAVNSNGAVKSVDVKGGSPVLAQSAQNAVRGWRWEKTDHETTELVEINFNQ